VTQNASAPSHPLRARVGGVLAASLCVCALAGGLVLAGCGEDEEEPAGEDLTALACPMEPAGEAEGVPQFEPAENSFDPGELVGMSLDDARAKAAEHGCDIVVSVADDEGQPVPVELNPKLIYVYTEGDEVTLIEGVGGGL